MQPATRARQVAAALLVLCALGATQAQAQMPARFYWKTLAGAQAVPLIVESLSGNTNPFDPAHTVTAVRTSTARLPWRLCATFSFLDRSTTAAIILPMDG